MVFGRDLTVGYLDPSGNYCLQSNSYPKALRTHVLRLLDPKTIYNYVGLLGCFGP